MTVTKQQQLEWLAKECDEWPAVNGEYFTMNRNAVGSCVHAHVITRKEWQQERDRQAELKVMTMQMCELKPLERYKMSGKPEVDSSWHERGELPPVGCECEIKHKCWIEPNEVKIAAITKEYVIVVDGQREQHYHLRDITFRPLSTERGKAIDEMAKLIGVECQPSPINIGSKRAAEILYDAGYRKVKP